MTLPGKASDTLKADIEQLKTFRDEMRVRIHLLGMDARDAFREISDETDKLLHQANAESHATVRSLIDKMKALTAKHPS